MSKPLLVGRPRETGGGPDLVHGSELATPDLQYPVDYPADLCSSLAVGTGTRGGRGRKLRQGSVATASYKKMIKGAGQNLKFSDESITQSSRKSF